MNLKEEPKGSFFYAKIQKVLALYTQWVYINIRAKLKEVNMTSTELRIKYEKALETVSKKEATIKRHEEQAKKKLDVLTKNDWLAGDARDYRDNNEAFWAKIEYEHKLEDVVEAKKKLKEAQQIAENWKEKLDRQIKLEETIENEVPEAFKEAKKALVASWVGSDIRRREKMYKAKQELEWKEFSRIYTYTEREFLSHSDEEFAKIEEREADAWLLNLYNRVKDITGEVTDCSHIHWGGKCLDGYVEGKEGKAIVETIEAGGYNIVRWHLRVLVKKSKRA